MRLAVAGAKRRMTNENYCRPEHKISIGMIAGVGIPENVNISVCSRV